MSKPLNATTTMKYTSNAKWPRMDAEYSNSEMTSDEHDSYEQAKAVCDMLDRDGFGGEGKMFPVKTWVEAKSPKRRHE